tara:strand:+ start:9836 stop:10663 length:828 start_codon:yes stop_codon:yes gene_type:complete
MSNKQDNYILVSPSRLKEFELLTSTLNDLNLFKLNILEIGGGSGWQVKKLLDQGHQVISIDVKEKSDYNLNISNVILYDGFNIPFEEKKFDMVFTSHVLEHIPHVEKFQTEIHRVLKDDGICAHFMPTSQWKIIGLIVWFPHIIKTLIKYVLTKFNFKNIETEKTFPSDLYVNRMVKRTIFQNLFLAFIELKFFPKRHGEIGNPITEIYYFSFYRWKKLFIKTNWKIIKYKKSGIFFTGYSIFEGWPKSNNFRKFLSTIFGSSSHFFILGKKNKL